MSNTTIQIKRSTATANPASLNYGELAYSFNGDKLFIGNSTSGVITIGGASYVTLLGATAGTLTASKAIIVDSNKLVDTLMAGNTTSNVVMNATAVTIANSTQNTVINQTGASFGNSTVNTSVAVATIFQGNSTVFRTANSTTDVLVSSTTANVALSGTQVLVQSNSTVNSLMTATTVGVANSSGNTSLNATGFLLQTNTTSNVVITSTSIKISNSTSNTTIPLATAAQYAGGNYYLNANGQWTTVATGVATPAGSNTQVQFNDQGSSNATAGFTFDKTTNTVTSANTLVAGTTTVNSTVISVGTGTVTMGVANVGTSWNVGANVTANTTTIFLGNSTVNTVVTSAQITQANSTFNWSLNPKTLTITDVTISGNLTVNGSTTLVNGTTVQYVDNMIKLAANNLTANSIDIGFYGVYGNSTVTQYAGLARVASDGKFYLFGNTTTEPSTTAVTTVKATLVANTVELTNPVAIAYGGTGLTSVTASAVPYVNSTSGYAFAGFGGDGTVLQMQSTTLAFAMLDGGTF